MRWRVSCLFALVAFVPPTAGASENERTFCDALGQSGLVNTFTPTGSIFYRDGSQRITRLEDGGEIVRDVEKFFYYIRPTPSHAGQASLLNIKYVFRGAPNHARRERVQLRNNNWKRLGHREAARVMNACARLHVAGYERFHLQNSRNHCLLVHFHQRHPDFETLDTIERRASFAFQGMLGEPEPSLFVTMFRALGPRQASADELVTNRYSHVRSWILNFTHGPGAAQCVGFDADFPEQAQSFQLQVTNHGTAMSPAHFSKSWTLRLRP
ncbi:MAG: hypothetical protein HXY30_02045 [Pseudorhodoplanes sp.]|nr:hypothetical protein [Pseudorhodoplanes sp.]